MTERIAESPGNKFEVFAIWWNTHHGPAAWHLAFDALSGTGRGSEWYERAGFYVALATKGIASREISAREDDVLAGHIMKLWLSLEPAKFEIVLADDARIAGGALTEIDFSIRSDDGPIRMMIAEAGKIR